MLRRSILKASILALSLALPFSSGRAQAAAGSVAQPYLQTAAINALGLPFGLFSAEYEAAVAPGFGVGAGGSYLSTGGYGDVRGWAEGKVLYYPSEATLSGLGVGLTGGFIRERDGDSGRSDTGVTFGVMGQYNWLLGPRRRFLVGAGAGAKRVVGSIPDDSPLNRIYLDGRAVIGIAF